MSSGGYLWKKGVNIKFIPILFLLTSFFLIQETLLNKNIPVSEVSEGGGGCTVGISSPRTNLYIILVTMNSHCTTAELVIYIECICIHPQHLGYGTRTRTVIISTTHPHQMFIRFLCWHMITKTNYLKQKSSLNTKLYEPPPQKKKKTVLQHLQNKNILTVSGQ